MSDGPDSLLPYLRRIDARSENLERKMDEVITRVAHQERDLAGVKVDHAATQLRLDNMDRRLDRIERRLDLVDIPLPAGDP